MEEKLIKIWAFELTFFSECEVGSLENMCDFKSFVMRIGSFAPIDVSESLLIWHSSLHFDL